MSALTGVSKRTLQVWRKDGFFVPALPPEATGHPERELYGLGDVVTVRVIRLLLDAGVDRAIVARVGEELAAWSKEGLLSFRGLASVEPTMWCVVLAIPEWAAQREEVLSFFAEDQFKDVWADDFELTQENDLVFLSADDEPPFGVAVPISSIGGEFAEKADRWRRQRRIPERLWPPWM